MQELPGEAPRDAPSPAPPSAMGKRLTPSTLDAARAVLKYHADRLTARQRLEHPPAEGEDGEREPAAPA